MKATQSTGSKMSTPSVAMCKGTTCKAPEQPQDKGITGTLTPRYTAAKSMPVAYQGA